MARGSLGCRRLRAHEDGLRRGNRQQGHNESLTKRRLRRWKMASSDCVIHFFFFFFFLGGGEDFDAG